MTLEDLKKHVRPLVWEKDERDNSLIPTNSIDKHAFVSHGRSWTWYSYADDKEYTTKVEAMQAVEDKHLRELAKFFELEG
ncbi:hypothetical protein [uncultured Porphyromonas sp.]|uniref:hypothetical protein n=1 Tax=uncultured Porphyromonas sp. TaxID=159274 RepID=UPI00260E06AC|nr:hypothetical protein [uncultured Porphyromonas sp.]